MRVKKRFFVGFSLLIFLSFITLSLINVRDDKINDINLDTWFCVEFRKAGTSEWKKLGCVHNVLTDQGKEDLEGIISGKYKYIALGNGSAPTPSSTSLDNEQTDCGLERKAGTYYDLGTGNWEINTTFTYTCDSSRTINTTAAFNATSGGVMLAGGTITEIPFSVNGDEAKIRHIYQIQEG